MSFSGVSMEQVRKSWQLPSGPCPVSRAVLKPIVAKEQLHMIYAVINPLTHAEVSNFFEESVYTLPALLKNKPVFFSQEAMMRHGRYQATSCTFLKFYVPESAILSQDSHLYLNTTCITQDNLQGCYVRTKSEQRYYRNPYFNSWFEKLYYGH